VDVPRSVDRLRVAHRHAYRRHGEVSLRESLGPDDCLAQIWVTVPVFRVRLG
jgi:hypothetical protein